ncbi:MAG: hypothetical protein PCFJNLEI_03315 [Verrucomicrobiae bacterium]|nr:hypothetical protein [Verrucomicrobiae bacterium]
MTTTLEQPTTSTATPTRLRFMVYGIPVAQGSKIACMNRHTGKPFVVDSANFTNAKGEKGRLDAWRRRVEEAALAAATEAGWSQTREPITVEMTFLLPKPARSTFDVPAVKPDLSKLFRAAEDGVGDAKIYHDDCEVVEIHCQKVYAETDCGVEIVVTKGGAL